MDYRLSTLAENRAKKHIRDRRAPAWAMRDIVASVAKKHPSPVWKKIESLDLAHEADRLQPWLTKLLRTQPPGDSINGLWFGLFETSTGRAHPSGILTLYVAGSARFHKRSPPRNWPCRPEWFPSKRYAKSQTLQAMSLLQPRNDFDTAFLIQCAIALPITMILVAELCRRIDPKLLLGDARFRGVGCGFDSGDFHVLGIVTPSGFEPAPSPKKGA
jgi:hypothetical protein